MEKYFNFIIHIYDENKEKRYFGDGSLIATDCVFEGYVCNDYLYMAQSDEILYVYFSNHDQKIDITTAVELPDGLEFPGNFAFRFPEGSQISMILLEVSSQIKDKERCKRVKEILEEVKKA